MNGKNAYFDLIATTGSILAAMVAGIMPANIPITMHIEMASPSMLYEMDMSK